MAIFDELQRQIKPYNPQNTQELEGEYLTAIRPFPDHSFLILRNNKTFKWSRTFVSFTDFIPTIFIEGDYKFVSDTIYFYRIQEYKITKNRNTEETIRKDFRIDGLSQYGYSEKTLLPKYLLIRRYDKYLCLLEEEDLLIPASVYADQPSTPINEMLINEWQGKIAGNYFYIKEFNE